MKGNNSVRSTSSSLASRAMRQGGLVLAGLLPVAAMGIAVPSAIDLREAKSQVKEVRERLNERDAVKARLEQWGNRDALATLQGLDSVLEQLIPTGEGPLSEFGAVRHAASEVSVKLDDVRHVRSFPVTGASNIFVDEVRVELSAPTEKLLELVDELRAAGHATVALGFNIARENAQRSAFQTELRLGFLRRVAGGATGTGVGGPVLR